MNAIAEWIARQVGAARPTFFDETLRDPVLMHGRFPQPLPLMRREFPLNQVAAGNALTSTQIFPVTLGAGDAMSELACQPIRSDAGSAKTTRARRDTSAK